MHFYKFVHIFLDLSRHSQIYVDIYKYIYIYAFADLNVPKRSSQLLLTYGLSFLVGNLLVHLGTMTWLDGLLFSLLNIQSNLLSL